MIALGSASEVINGQVAPLRQHQEDITQAFGIMPEAKYRQLEPSTVTVLANFFRNSSANPAQDIANLTRLLLFNYLIGNCDNHLKNISILYSFDWKSFQMAPAYDLVSTTYFARFSSTMGMAIGNHLDIREVTPEDFHIMAERIGINMRLIRNMVKEFQQRATAALNTEGNLLSEQGFRASSLYS